MLPFLLFKAKKQQPIDFVKDDLKVNRLKVGFLKFSSSNEVNMITFIIALNLSWQSTRERYILFENQYQLKTWMNVKVYKIKELKGKLCNKKLDWPKKVMQLLLNALYE